MRRLEDTLSRITEPDAAVAAVSEARHKSLTKPPGSLGRLETLAIRLAAITGQPRPRLPNKLIAVFAADHGVVEEGVNAYPQAVTQQMLHNFARGGAAINVLARQAGSRLRVVDIGTIGTLPPAEGVTVRRIAPGTRNFCREPAMSREEAILALETGIEIFEEEWKAGTDVVCTGDMGIGNTTPSAAITAAVTGRPPDEVTGRGTGVSDDGLRLKIAAVRRALTRDPFDPHDGIELLRQVGGFEIGGLAGVIVAAAARRVPVLIDGFISGAAALIANALCPKAKAFMIAAHCSTEPGHRAALEHLGLQPLLDLNLRLGEGTGAALALHLVEASCRILDEMATFEEAAVAKRETS